MSSYDTVPEGLRAVVDLMMDQENFHQRVLGELLGRTRLGAELALWDRGLPRVVLEPLRGLFDLALQNDSDTVPVFIELKSGSWLGVDQFQRQAQHVQKHRGRRAYVLLGPTYWAWHRNDEAAVIGLPGLTDAILRAEPSIEDTGLRQLALTYAAALGTQRPSWEGSLPDRAADWRAHDWFRFFDGLLAAWEVPAAMYPVTNPGGQDYILSPRPGWITIQGLGGDAALYWELVFGKVRFKIRWLGAPEERRRIRDMCRMAYLSAAREQGIVLEHPRSRPGAHMSLVELSGDVRDRLLHEGELDVREARDLLNAVTRLHENAASRLSGP